MLLKTNERKKFPDFSSKYVTIFAKSKYDIGKINPLIDLQKSKFVMLFSLHSFYFVH